MYEPIILRKSTPRSLAGTPAAKANILIKSTGVLIPLGCLFLFSEYFSKKAAIIDELEERNNYTRTLNMYQEYQLTRDFWDRGALRGIINSVLEQYQSDNTLFTTGKASLTLSDIVKKEATK